MNINMGNGSSIFMSDKGDGVKSIFTDDKAIIAKQAEQIKMLREALELFKPEIYYNQNGEEVDVGGNFTIYSDGDADNEAMQKVHEALEATKEQA